MKISIIILILNTKNRTEIAEWISRRTLAIATDSSRTIVPGTVERLPPILVVDLFIIAVQNSSKTVFYSTTRGQTALSGHLIETIQNVPTVYMCVSLCEMEATCKSINYDAAGRVCELNNESASEASRFESRGSLVYYAPASAAILP